MPAAPATQAEIQRAVKAWLALGLPLGGVEVTKDGTIRVFPPLDNHATPVQPSPDQPEAW